MTLLAGLDTPSQGSIELLGQPISGMDDEARAALRSESIGFVFQSFLLIPSLSALENVLLPALIKGEAADEARAHDLLAQVGLAGRENHLRRNCRAESSSEWLGAGVHDPSARAVCR